LIEPCDGGKDKPFTLNRIEFALLNRFQNCPLVCQPNEVCFANGLSKKEKLQ